MNYGSHLGYGVAAFCLLWVLYGYRKTRKGGQ